MSDVLLQTYKCNPEKNAKCLNTYCHINGGECEHTTQKEYAIEENEQHES